MGKTVGKIGTGLQLIPMLALGGYLLFASLLLVGNRAGYQPKAGFELNRSATELWYGLAIIVVGMLAIRWFKAAVLLALLAGIPIALAIAGTVSDRVDFLDRDVVMFVAPWCAISLVGFAIRVLATPEPAANPQVSSSP